MKNFIINLFLVFQISLLPLIVAGQTQADIADLPLDSRTRTELINETLATIKNNYWSAEIGQKMESGIRARLARHEYDPITSAKVLAVMLTLHLQEICQDKHVTVQIADRNDFNSGRDETASAENLGFTKVEILPSNIGYVQINSFPPPEQSADTAAAAMKFVEKTDALIIDIRRHTGGAIPMVAHMVSYFVAEKPIQLITVDAPREQFRFESWTVEKLKGPRYLNRPVYIVTSRETFSGGEEFAYDMQALKRAKLIGERTKGGANPGKTFLIQNIFRVGVSFAQVRNSITGTNWENVGVKPDIETTADRSLSVAIETAQKNLAETKLSTVRAEPEVKNSGLPELTAFPDTPIGKTFQLFIPAFNSGNRDKLIEFHLGRLPDTVEGKRIAEENSREDLEFYKTSGGLIARKILSATATKIELICQFKQRNEWIIFTMEVESAPPHSIIGLNVTPTASLK